MSRSVCSFQESVGSSLNSSVGRSPDGRGSAPRRAAPRDGPRTRTGPVAGSGRALRRARARPAADRGREPRSRTPSAGTAGRRAGTPRPGTRPARPARPIVCGSRTDPAGGLESGSKSGRAVQLNASPSHDACQPLEGPVAVLLEDLHWADPGTVVALRAIGRRLGASAGRAPRNLPALAAVAGAGATDQRVASTGHASCSA